MDTTRRGMLEPAALQALVAAPGFMIGVRCSDSEIISVSYLARETQTSQPNPLGAEAARQIRAYLADSNFVFNLPLAHRGTDFQQRVWSAIAAIPAGETRSYSQLATSLASAPRAIGQACGANPFPLIVPCHRVTALRGPGGFAHQRGGFMLDVKRWLLAHEYH